MIIGVSAKTDRFSNICIKLGSKYFYKKRKLNNIPVIINNFNRYTYLLSLIGWLENSGIENIFIIDNCSSYPQLLDYYRTTSHVVFRLDLNVGHRALWDTHIYRLFKHDYYVYTDPDILPIEECPASIIAYFKEVLDKHPEIDKVGFGLRIDDLPEHFALKGEVINWENQFWKKKIEPELYEAKIDTTFALYRPGKAGGAEISALRTGFPYIARHLPWYLDSKNLSDEEKYYIEHTNISSTWYQRVNNAGKYELQK